MTTSLKIGIIGAGPSGLTLARLLFLSTMKIEVTLYETDQSPTSRSSQGGTLDLHPETGLAAIDKCQLWESFRKYARYDASRMVIADKHGIIVMDLGEEVDDVGQERPEIDRVKLRDILLESVPNQWIRWDHHLKEVTEDGMLRFTNKEEEEIIEGPFDLIVGADGAWSKVRNILHGVKPVYSGVSGFQLKIENPSMTSPSIDQMVGKGTYCAFSDQNWLSGQKLGDGSIEIRSFFACHEGEATDTLDKLGKEDTRDYILQKSKGWASEVTQLVTDAEIDSIKAWTLYELPVGCKWQHKKGFTLIGDAASLATPFAGEGVNKAMADALELANSIEKLASSENTGINILDIAVVDYEQRMFPRAEKMQSETMMNKNNMLGPGGSPIKLLTGMFGQFFSEHRSPWIRMLGPVPLLAFTNFLKIRWLIGWAKQKYWT